MHSRLVGRSVTTSLLPDSRSLPRSSWCHPGTVGSTTSQGWLLSSLPAHRMTPAGASPHLTVFRIPCMFPLRCQPHWLAVPAPQRGTGSSSCAAIERRWRFRSYPWKRIGPILNLRRSCITCQSAILDAALELQANGCIRSGASDGEGAALPQEASRRYAGRSLSSSLFTLTTNSEKPATAAK